MSYIGNEPIVSATRTITEVTATAGQTVFNANGGYTVGYIDVFLNGSKLTTTDFTATNGSSITLTEAAQVGDIVRLEALGTFLTSSGLTSNNPSYTGTLTGGTGVVNIGSGQIYKSEAGNVGIGTSSPTNFGSAFKMLAVQGSDYGIIQAISSSGSTTLEMMGASGIGYVGTRTNHPLAFRTNDTERMRIDSSGRHFLMPSAYLIGDNGSFRQYIAGTSGGTAYRVNTNSDWAIGFYNASNAHVGNIAVNSSSTSYVTTSDYRLKENVEPMTGALSKVQSLKPVTYKWKIDGSAGEGFIAHELAEVVPQCVTGEKDAVESYIDEDGVEQTRPKYQGIDTSFLVATLTAAIQEQQALIQSQADTITAMEQRLTALEGKQ